MPKIDTKADIDWNDIPADDSTIEISGGNLQVKDSGVTPAKLSGTTAGDFTVASESTEVTTAFGSTTYVKKYQIAIPRSGALRYTIELKSSNAQTTYCKAYRDGTAVGTEKSVLGTAYAEVTDDISGWTSGDLFQIYVKTTTDTTGYARNLVLKVAEKIAYSTEVF